MGLIIALGVAAAAVLIYRWAKNDGLIKW